MIPIFLKNILKSPIGNNNLLYSNDKILDEINQNEYLVLNNIPILLPQESKLNEFNLDYIKHYGEDHKYFDYFVDTTCLPQLDDERRVHEVIINKVSKNAINILDVGCGGAWVANHFTKLKKNVISFDISIINVSKALKFVDNENHFGVVGDALNPPFLANSFDCIIASEIIEHVVDPKEFISQLFKLLKPNGQLIITTPYNELIKMETCIHCNGQTPRNSHLHTFDEKILKSYNPILGANNYSYRIFGNKAMLFARTYIITKYFKLGLWNFMDSFANFIVNKRSHIIVEYCK